MAASGARDDSSVMTELLAAADNLQSAVARMRAALGRAQGTALGEGLIKIREAGIDALEAVFAEGLRRFDQSGEYAADGAVIRTDSRTYLDDPYGPDFSFDQRPAKGWRFARTEPMERHIPEAPRRKSN